MLPTVASLTAEVEAEFAALIDAEYPRFSPGEMARRRQRFDDLCAAEGLDAIIVAHAQKVGTTTFWLTGWPTTADAVTLLVPGRPMKLWVQHVNHQPLAAKLADTCDVEWGGKSGLGHALAALAADKPGQKRIGLVGTLSASQHASLSAAGVVVDLNAAYSKMRYVKSAEEMPWFRFAAAMSDLGAASLAERAKPGMTEKELGALVEAPYVKLGGTNALHYIGTTPMADPSVGVPRQFPSSRRLKVGDALVCEISAQFWDHSGQVLRTFAVGAEPNALYRELHACADAVFDAVTAKVRAGATPAELVAASHGIEDAGFTIIDDLVHGYGGGYFPPVLGCASRPSATMPDMKLEAGMMLVVQPNITTRDRRAGVQTGHLLLVTETGFEPMQRFPRGFHVIG
jgi:Xaa-Pro aminopeptidase